MLLTIEGLDGSGKTTAIEAIQHSSLCSDAVYTREPTGSWYGDAVRRSVGDDEADSLAELFLYTADHAAHLAHTVRPALSRGQVVISDRYSDSRYAYQGATLADRFDDALSFVRQVHQPWTRPPDVTLYLDVGPETGAERSGVTNKFETVSFLTAVESNYERLISEEPDRFIRIDATQPEAAVTTDVLEAVKAVL